MSATSDSLPFSLPPSFEGGRVFFFFLALLLYALLGSPTPDSPGGVEAVIFVLLLLSVCFHFPGPAGQIAIFFFCGLVVPAGIGLARGNDLSALLRDIVALCFLFLPLFYGGLTNRPTFVRLLAALLIFTGCLFSLRTILTALKVATMQIGVSPFHLSSLLSFSSPPDLLYLANSPEVLFAALALQGLGFYRLGLKGDWKGGILAFLLSLLPLLAMIVMRQRAFLAVSLLSGVFWFLFVFWKHPQGIWRLCLLFLPFAFFLLPFWQNVADILISKTHLVGLNGRIEEWHGVATTMSFSPGRNFFGLGWGATFENPAVAYIRVGYTHSLLSFLWLKTGVLGLAASMAVLLSLGRGLFRLRGEDLFWTLMTLPPVFITLFLYASYKSFGFGLLLLLLYALLWRERNLEKNRPVVA